MLFAHNDDMALGAIQAIEAAGKKPGKDIKIVSIDGVKDGFEAMAEGKINDIVECNPLLGPQLMDLSRRSRPARRSSAGSRPRRATSPRTRPRPRCRPASTDRPGDQGLAARQPTRPAPVATIERRANGCRRTVHSRAGPGDDAGSARSSRASGAGRVSTSGSSPARCTP